ncbi:pilus assembly protein CpaE [Xylanimonas ulmi]|uniref:Pilus assembly protein CpaE n=1 Tax=Xylanimonas ulmi TaxID=228973 RepID=A0A4Q7M2U0_9MICO|nr:pilus assembly protein CpaE [Xylanibacterium ulmi]RZS61804.1 hypothetical protein EV386_2115 [Xylanibacterium ulmi]
MTISRDAAERLRAAGLLWRPRAGDRFAVLSDALAEDVFTVSDMVVERHDYASGTILGFNGTTEWALDSVPVEDTLWLPREDQLRELLGPAFRSLARSTMGWYQVLVEIPGHPEQVFDSENPADAYAEALLTLVRAAID